MEYARYCKREKTCLAKLLQIQAQWRRENFHSALCLKYLNSIIIQSSCIFTEKLSRYSSKPWKSWKFSSANLSTFMAYPSTVNLCIIIWTPRDHLKVSRLPRCSDFQVSLYMYDKSPFGTMCGLCRCPYLQVSCLAGFTLKSFTLVGQKRTYVYIYS